jgi:uncharacterized protein YndB with AHSA1/START domain
MMLFIVLGVLLTIILIVAIAIFVRMPKVLKIKRSQVIHASPEKLFPYINNSRRIQEWNPFIEGDATVELTYTGPADGLGAQWTWSGSKSGAGMATITASEQNRRVALRLDFRRPFKVTNFGEYSLAPQGAVTEVTWLIDETASLPRAMSVFINLEKIVGIEFEKGLRKLKSLAENG